VLLLPATDSASAPAEAPRLAAALRLLRGTPGADTANVGAWAVGPRATALVQVLSGPNNLRTTFFIAQNAELDPAGRASFRELRNRKIPLLGLYGGTGAAQRAAALRNALGGWRGANIRAYRAAGANLLVPGSLSPSFGPGLPNEVVEWLRGK
jgi:hypothetical protein